MKCWGMLWMLVVLLAGSARAEVGPSVGAGVGGAMGGAGAAKRDVRGDFLTLIERPRVAANVQVQAGATANGLRQTAFTLEAEKGQTVPGILLMPENASGKMPVVIYLHGTGGKKEDGLALLRTLAGRGIMGVAIDGRYHGARAAAFPKEGAMNAYETAIYHAWKEHDPARVGDEKGILPAHPLYYDTVWDIMRLIDYLATRADVDAGRIGVYGVSKGGIEAYMAAAVDTRIAVAVPTISVESFQWALENEAWKPRVETFQKAFDAAAKDAGVAVADKAFVKQFYDRVMPGIDGEFDGPSLVGLIAPRPLMAINGEKDPRTQPAALKLATDAAQAAYKAAGAEERLVVLIQPNTPHQVKPEAQAAGVEFLVKWLKP